MPARRKTARELELSGALKVNPGRYQGRGSVDCGPLGDPPKHLSTAAKNAWREIAANAPEGLLTSSDRCLVEIATVLLCRVRNRRTPVKNAELNALTNVLTKLGLTPVDRAKVDLTPSVPPIEKDDPLAFLLEN